MNIQQPQSKFVGQLHQASVIIAIIVICLGSSTILGWLLDLTFLKSIIAERVTMKVSTALGLILGGISLLLWHQQQHKNSLLVSVGLYLFPSLAIAFSFFTLIEYGFNLDLGTSWLSLEKPTDPLDILIRGRMAPNTAWSFLLWNTAILLLNRKYYLTSQLLVIFVTAITSVSLLSHIYDINSFYSLNSLTGMAIHTALGLILLCLALLGTRAERGWMKILTRDEAGGLMGRWLLPLVVIIPPLLGWLFWWLFHNNLFNSLELMIVLRIISEMVIFGVIIWWTAKKLNQIDRQRQQFSQNLLAAERKYRAIFDQTFQFIGLLTPEGRVLEANQTILDFGGIAKSDVVGKFFWETYWWQISPETQRDLQNAIATARTGVFVRYQVEVRGTDERVITIDFSLRPVTNEAGEVILLIPEGRDISAQQAAFKEKTRAEQALKASEARYRAIVEDQTELICRYLPDATVLFVNDAYCRYFGFEKEDLIGHQYIPVVYEADRERVFQSINSMNVSNPSVTIENRVWTKGKVRWTQWNNRIIFGEGGEVWEYQSVGRDITDVKQIEAKLRESEERFRRAFEDAATGEALVSPNGRFIKVNRSLCDTIGYSEPELLGKTFQEITHPEDLALDLNYIRQMLAGEIRTYQMEKRYLHQQGHFIWILLSVSLVRDIHGNVIYLIAQIQDIERRKQAEAQLKELVKELERSNRELDEFASVVSHDLLAPLRKQQTLVDLLQEDCGEALLSPGREHLSRIIDLSKRMELLIRNLLAYARIATQVQPFLPVSLNQVIQDVLYDLETEIAVAKATIEVGELPTINSDRLQLRQLFHNLIQNALKFHASDRLPEITINLLPSTPKGVPSNYICLVITDNGIGFEPEQQEKIFTPFHRLHGYSKYEGTGLGLAICYKIIQRHQGTISAQSQPGKGATFTICLPVNL